MKLTLENLQKIKKENVMEFHTTNYFSVEQKTKSFIFLKLPAKVVTKISYAAVRGRDNEEGAVQRFLNPKRINNVKDFTLNIGDFPNSIVLNWVNSKTPLEKTEKEIRIPLEKQSAQLIDGQHRVAGIQAAIEEDETIGDMEIPVVIYDSLQTKDCANLFLSINTEQKPVPRSLVFDLYGVTDAEDPIVDKAATRARDIAVRFHDDDSSPYRGYIKFPGQPRMRGGIALSTFVTTIKPLLEDKGDFDQLNISELEMQQNILMNFFNALKNEYGETWYDQKNAFLYASGFIGAVDFFKSRVMHYCFRNKSFTVDTISKILNLRDYSLIYQEEVKGIGGKEAPRLIYQRLVDSFDPIREDETKIEY